MGTFLEFFLGPIITAAFVAVFYFFATPHAEKKALIKKEMWLSKKDAFLDAIRVIDKHFGSGKWGGTDIPKDYVPSGEKPSVDEMNKAYRNLMLLCDNIEIPKRFIGFLVKGGVGMPPQEASL